MSRIGKLFPWAVFVAACLFFKPANVFAEFKLIDAIEEFGEKRFVAPMPNRLHAGPLQFHPTLGNQAQYDSNVLWQPKAHRDDFVFNIRPGAILELPVNRHQVVVGYEADFEIFAKNRRQDDVNQNAFALVDLQFPSWYVNMLENWAETSGRAGTTFTERIPRYDNNINPKVGYRWKRFTVESGFRHFLREFRRIVDKTYNFRETEWTGVLYYDLFARLKALLEYQFAHISYRHALNRDGNFNQVRIGLDGEVMPNLRVKVRAGAQFRDYVTSDKPDFNSFVGDIIAEYKMRKNLRFKLNLSREPVEATFADVNFYVEHVITFGVEYDPHPKWTLFSECQYIRHHYEERAADVGHYGYRRDSHVFPKVGARYKLQEWMKLELSYWYGRRDSNFSTFDYTDHRITLQTNFQY